MIPNINNVCGALITNLIDCGVMKSSNPHSGAPVVEMILQKKVLRNKTMYQVLKCNSNFQRES